MYGALVLVVCSVYEFSMCEVYEFLMCEVVIYQCVRVSAQSRVCECASRACECAVSGVRVRDLGYGRQNSYKMSRTRFVDNLASLSMKSCFSVSEIMLLCLKESHFSVCEILFLCLPESCFFVCGISRFSVYG